MFIIGDNRTNSLEKSPAVRDGLYRTRDLGKPEEQTGPIENPGIISYNLVKFSLRQATSNETHYPVRPLPSLGLINMRKSMRTNFENLL